MEQELNLVKEVYGRNTYVRVVDTSFSELFVPTTIPIDTPTITVEQFFDYYNDLFFEIPAMGEVNSHEYLVKRSGEYLGGGVVSDTERAYIEEINSLRQQLLEANQNYSNLSNII